METKPINSIEYKDSTQIESENLRPTDKNFYALLEKERLKINFMPYFINFQNNSPALTMFNSDDHKVSDLYKSGSCFDQKNTHSADIYPARTNHDTIDPQNKASETANDQNNNIKTGLPADQTRSAQNKVENILLINIRALSEFRDMLIEAKNRVTSIKEVGLEEILNTIADKAKVIKENERTELLLKLRPENLGEILVAIAKEKGNISVTIYAQENTKKLLEQDISELEKSLKNANMNISNLQVSISDQKSGGHLTENEEIVAIPTVGAIVYNKSSKEINYMDSISVEEALGLDRLGLIFSDA